MLHDLNEAVEGKELNQLSYNPQDYPQMDVMLHHLLSGKPKVGIDTVKLAKNGRIVKDTMNEYMSAKGYNSSSALKEVLKTPLHYYFYIEQTFKQETKAHFELGTFAHMAFLEPELFERCIVEPDVKLNTLDGCNRLIAFWEGRLSEQSNYAEILSRAVEFVEEENLKVDKIDGKRRYIEWLKFGGGFMSVNQEQKAIVELLKRHYHSYGGGILPMILNGAERETSFYTTDPETGLNVKVRPDAFNISENCGVDCIISFKTTSAHQIGKFIYDSAKFTYELSEGMYQEVVSHVTGRMFNTTICIMLQTSPPYLPAVFWWNPEDLANGKYKYRHCLSVVKDCYDKRNFPGFDAMAQQGSYGIIEMNQPEWAKKIIAPVDIEE